jgi:WD40 repeat protein
LDQKKYFIITLETPEEALLQEALAALQVANDHDSSDGEFSPYDYYAHTSSLEPHPLPDPSADENNTSGNIFSEESLALLNADEDLVAALLSMDVGENPAEIEENKDTHKADQDSSSTPNTTVTSTLPELEFDFGEDNFLVEPDQLFSVFDHHSEGEDGADLDEEFNSDTEEIEDHREEQFLYPLSADSEEFPLDVDLETDQLYQELANMSLNDQNNALNGDGPFEDPFAMDPEAMQSIPAGNDGLPFYLWCQPCNVIGGEGVEDEFQPLDPILPPISEHQPLDDVESEIVRHAQEYHSRDLQELYQQSQRHKRDPQDTAEGLIQLDPSDPLMQELATIGDAEPESQTWWNAAQPWAKAFGVDLKRKDIALVPSPTKDVLKTCIGHKETIYGVKFSHDSKFIVTASQDSIINVWETATNRLITSLKGHSTAYECLRVDWASPKWADEVLDREGRFQNIIASAGADGLVKIWTCKDVKGNEWKCEHNLDHAKLLGRGVAKVVEGENGEETKEEGDKPQVYALQFIDNWKVFTKQLQQQHCDHHQQGPPTSLSQNEEWQNSFLMTSSDEFIHFWEVVGHPFDQQLQFEHQKIHLLQDNEIKMKEVMSLHFGKLDDYGYGVTACSVTGQGLKLPPPPKPNESDDQKAESFGGERNPHNIVFVFDADYCPASGLLGVALSDGSLRLVNGRGICISVLNLPGNQSHLTSFCWDSTGNRLATCVATGHLITWSLDTESHQSGNHNTVATCTAIFEGGHQPGRPLFGSRFCGDDEELLVSWGVDGKLCLWGSHSQGNIYAPIANLKEDPDYPVYALDISKNNVAIGGGSNGGFIGIPLYLANLPAVQKSEEPADEHSSPNSRDVAAPQQKKPKTDETNDVQFKD